jgi:hypothetical protein
VGRAFLRTFSSSAWTCCGVESAATSTDAL